MKHEVTNQKILFPELSYEIIGASFDVFNEIGAGHKELVYHRAMSVALKKRGLAFEEQQYAPIKFQGVPVGKNFFDFLVDKKIVVEIKSADRFTKAQFEQVTNYLNIAGIQLGIIILFTRDSVKSKRVLNLQLLNQIQ